MMTMREARQRLSLHTMQLSVVQDSCPKEYRVSFADVSYKTAEASAYYTDDLEDAVLTGASMRRRKDIPNGVLCRRETH